MIYYIIFSYLFLIGTKMEHENLPLWNLLFAPITFPMLLGQWFAHKY
jgi:hypothetical protein